MPNTTLKVSPTVQSNPFHHRFERSHRSGGAYLKTTDGSQVTNCGNITTISKPIN
jgi:hypothetical protein